MSRVRRLSIERFETHPAPFRMLDKLVFHTLPKVSREKDRRRS